MKVLVTGAGGSLGRRLSVALTARGASVVGLDSGACPEVLRPHLADWIGADLRKGPPAIDGCDAVVHLAALSGLAAEADPQATVSVNAGSTAALLRQAGATGARFVLASSLAAIGVWEGDNPAPDDAPCRPESAYGRSKALAEASVRAAAEGGIRALALRLPTLLIRSDPRAGPPTTGFLSDIANDLLATGRAQAPMPVDFAVAVAGLHEAVEALARLALAPWQVWPAVINLPAFSLTPQALAQAVACYRPGLQLKCFKTPDPAIMRAAGGWPKALSSSFGTQLLAQTSPQPRLAAIVAKRAKELAGG